MVLLPYDLLAYLFLYLDNLVDIVYINKDVYQRTLSRYKIRAAHNKIRPYILRLQACYFVRKKFIDRLKRDVLYRQRYLYIHNTESNPTHLCWRKMPPVNISVHRDLETIQTLIREDINVINAALEGFRPEQYMWLLKHVAIDKDTIRILN